MLSHSVSMKWPIAIPQPRPQVSKRRERDSNPRSRFTLDTDLANRRIRPLCHLSRPRSTRDLRSLKRRISSVTILEIPFNAVTGIGPVAGHPCQATPNRWTLRQIQGSKPDRSAYDGREFRGSRAEIRQLLLSEVIHDQPFVRR